MEDLISTTVEEIVETTVRQNPFCVISLEVFGENAVHDIQTNTLWNTNPYSEGYAVVPDEMVQGIVATKGYCDIILNEDGTEVASFTAREIPVIEPEKEEEPTPTSDAASWDEMAAAIEEGVNEV